MFSSRLPFAINDILQPAATDCDNSKAMEPDPTRASSPAASKYEPPHHLPILSPTQILQLQQRFISDHLMGAGAQNKLGAKDKRPGHPYQSRAPPRHKKPRTSFTKSQVAFLETRFLEQKYLASAERATLACQLNMSDAQVKTWFQNRRTKWRRQEAEEREYASKTTSKLLSMTAQCWLQR